MVVRLERKTSLFRSALFLISFLKRSCDLPVIASYRGERFVGYAIRQHIGIKHPNKTVATTNAVVEKTQWLASPVPLQPKSQLAKIDRKWIQIDTIHTMGNHI